MERNNHDFNHSKTVKSRNLWRINMSSFTHHTFIVLPPYPAKQTLLLISVLNVLFYWLNLSLDSIKMMCGCSSQVAMLDVSAAILYNSFKTSTPFIDTVIGETLWWFLPLGDYRSLQLFHRLELSLVVDSLLMSTPNSVIHGINIKVNWRPHVRFNEAFMLFFR